MTRRKVNVKKTALNETPDGMLFKSRARANQHEAWLTLLGVVERALDVSNEDHVGQRVAKQIAKQIADNASDFASVLRANPADLSNLIGVDTVAVMSPDVVIEVVEVEVEVDADPAADTDAAPASSPPAV